MEGLSETQEMRGTRMSVNINAKGYAQWEVAVEYETPEETSKQLGVAVESIRALIKEKGLTEACAAV